MSKDYYEEDDPIWEEIRAHEQRFIEQLRRDRWERQWKSKLEREREKVLFWDRPFLPKTLPQNEITEESVVLYLKKIKPQLGRANNRFLRFVDWFLFDLVFGGLLVFCSFWAPWGSLKLFWWGLSFTPIEDELVLIGIIAFIGNAFLVFFLGLWWIRDVYVWVLRLLRISDEPHVVEEGLLIWMLNGPVHLKRLFQRWIDSHNK